MLEAPKENSPKLQVAKIVDYNGTVFLSDSKISDNSSIKQGDRLHINHESNWIVFSFTQDDVFRFSNGTLDFTTKTIQENYEIHGVDLSNTGVHLNPFDTLENTRRLSILDGNLIVSTPKGKPKKLAYGISIDDSHLTFLYGTFFIERTHERTTILICNQDNIFNIREVSALTLNERKNGYKILINNKNNISVSFISKAEREALSHKLSDFNDTSCHPL